MKTNKIIFFFAHDTAYADGKDLAKRIVSEKVLKDRVFEIALNLTYDWYQRWLACMVYTFLIRKQDWEKEWQEKY